MSCQVSENPKNGPLTSQPAMSATATINHHAEPTIRTQARVTWWKASRGDQRDLFVSVCVIQLPCRLCLRRMCARPSYSGWLTRHESIAPVFARNAEHITQQFFIDAQSQRHVLNGRARFDLPPLAVFTEPQSSAMVMLHTPVTAIVIHSATTAASEYGAARCTRSGRPWSFAFAFTVPSTSAMRGSRWQLKIAQSKRCAIAAFIRASWRRMPTRQSHESRLSRCGGSNRQQRRRVSGLDWRSTNSNRGDSWPRFGHSGRFLTSAESF